MYFLQGNGKVPARLTAFYPFNREAREWCSAHRKCPLAPYADSLRQGQWLTRSVFASTRLFYHIWQ